MARASGSVHVLITHSRTHSFTRTHCATHLCRSFDGGPSFCSKIFLDERAVQTRVSLILLKPINYPRTRMRTRMQTHPLSHVRSHSPTQARTHSHPHTHTWPRTGTLSEEGNVDFELEFDVRSTTFLIFVDGTVMTLKSAKDTRYDLVFFIKSMMEARSLSPLSNSTSTTVPGLIWPSAFALILLFTLSCRAAVGLTWLGRLGVLTPPSRFITRVWWMRCRASSREKPRSFPTYKMVNFQVSITW